VIRRGGKGGGGVGRERGGGDEKGGVEERKGGEEGRGVGKGEEKGNLTHSRFANFLCNPITQRHTVSIYDVMIYAVSVHFANSDLFY